MKTLFLILALATPAVAGNYRITNSRGQQQWGRVTNYGGTINDSYGNFGWWQTRQPYQVYQPGGYYQPSGGYYAPSMFHGMQGGYSGSYFVPSMYGW